MSAFDGIVPAIPTPMDAAGRVAEEALRKVVEFNIAAGVHGFWVSGGTGESVLLDDAENMRVAEIVVDQGKGRVNNIIHVGAATTARAAQLAEHAARVGAEAICCVPPFFYGRSDAEIVAHYRVVAALAAALFALACTPLGPLALARLLERGAGEWRVAVGGQEGSLLFGFTLAEIHCHNSQLSFEQPSGVRRRS